MTPKEKAKELVDKMRNINTEDYQLGKMYFIVPKQIAILQALITVDEILDIIRYHGTDIGKHSLMFWQEVKQEIEKL